MKTRKIAPRKVREGQQIVIETLPRDMCRNGNPRAFKVISVAKGRGMFTGASMWRVKFADPSHPWGFYAIAFHGKSGNLPTEKVTILA